MSFENLSASEILNIKEPEFLFTGKIEEAKKEFKSLAKLWHPDKNKSINAGKVMAHISALYSLAEERINLGRWQIPGLLILTDKKGKPEYHIKYKKRHSFELGDMYISDQYVTYVLDKTNIDLLNNAKATIKMFKFSSDKMEKEFKRYLPQVKSTFDTIDGKVCIVINKTKDLLLLKDVLSHFKGKIEDRHVAWIMSRLHNITCYLNYAGLVHNDISPETVFISPEHHTIALLGGWWYAGKEGKKMLAVPKRTYELLPPDVLGKKKATSRTDLELIRAVGRELLGDASGFKLTKMKAAPPEMIYWLRWPSPTGNAMEDFEKWNDEVLKASFGKKKFIELKLTVDDIYPK